MPMLQVMKNSWSTTMNGCCRDSRMRWGDEFDVGRRDDARQQDAVFITSAACHQVKGHRCAGIRTRPVFADAHAAGEAASDCAQQLVADFMAEVVIDALEVVEVDAQRGNTVARVVGFAHQLAELLLDHDPVRQAGDAVVEGEVVYLLLGASALRDVLERADYPVTFVLCLQHGMLQDRARLAVCAGEAEFNRLIADVSIDDGQGGSELAVICPLRRARAVRRLW